MVDSSFTVCGFPLVIWCLDCRLSVRFLSGYIPAFHMWSAPHPVFLVGGGGKKREETTTSSDISVLETDMSVATRVNDLAQR